MIDNGYPEELVRFCDMQVSGEGQARYIVYNLGKHLGLYEDNDTKWGDLDRSGWFYVTGFHLYNLLKKDALISNTLTQAKYIHSIIILNKNLTELRYCRRAFVNRV